MIYRVGLEILHSLVVLGVAVTLVFGAMRLLPGDAISTTLEQSSASQSDIQAQRDALCLSCPMHVQYINYLGDLLQGDLGFSLRYQQPVMSLIRQNLPATLALSMSAFAVALLVGTVLGIIYGASNGWLYNLSESIIIFTQAVPVYVLGVLGIYLFSVYLDILPAVGSTTPAHLILPASALGFQIGGTIARVLGENLRANLTAPFMLTARAKGLPPIDQLDHAIRLAILPVLNVLALQIGFLMSGTVIMEYLFVRQGLGKLLYTAVLNRDYPLVQALVLLSALVYLIANNIAQILQYLIDPRLRSEQILHRD